MKSNVPVYGIGRQSHDTLQKCFVISFYSSDPNSSDFEISRQLYEVYCCQLPGSVLWFDIVYMFWSSAPDLQSSFLSHFCFAPRRLRDFISTLTHLPPTLRQYRRRLLLETVHDWLALRKKIEPHRGLSSNLGFESKPRTTATETVINNNQVLGTQNCSYTLPCTAVRNPPEPFIRPAYTSAIPYKSA
jgi:hypothetical protein